MAGKPLAGDLLDGEPLAGDLLDGEPLAGELAGNLLAGVSLPGEFLAGEPISNWKVLDFCLVCCVCFFDCFDFSFLAPWRFVLRPATFSLGAERSLPHHWIADHLDAYYSRCQLQSVS